MSKNFSNIIGHSNFIVKRINKNNIFYIKKSVNTIADNDRLYKQFEKQHHFKLNKIENIVVPEIIKYGKKNNKFFFIMEYYNSHDYIEFSEINNYNMILKYINILINFIEYSINQCRNYSIVTINFLKKYESVKNNIKHLKIDLSKIDNLFNNTKNIKIPIGYNHGDLTFSNMLFSKNSKDIILIDFLDNFIETPLNDIIKLRQDTKHHWIYNMYSGKLDITRMNILFDKLDKTIDNYFSKYDFYSNYERIFSILNLLRILQYAKNNNIINYIKKELKNNYDI